VATAAAAASRFCPSFLPSLFFALSLQSLFSAADEEGEEGEKKKEEGKKRDTALISRR
jgi:hypothetical protein